VSRGILFVVLLSSANVEGHTVCCFTVLCKWRGAYCLLFYFHVQVSRGILFVVLLSCASVEGHTVCCCDVVIY